MSTYSGHERVLLARSCSVQVDGHLLDVDPPVHPSSGERHLKGMVGAEIALLLTRAISIVMRFAAVPTRGRKLIHKGRPMQNSIPTLTAIAIAAALPAFAQDAGHKQEPDPAVV